MMNFISINIIYTRNQNRLSQKDIAKMFEVTQTTLSNYETGKNEPTLSFVVRFCKEFNISIDDFVNVDLSKRPEVRRDYVEDKKAAPLPVSIEDLYKKTIAALESSLQSRDGVIEEKERIIQMLEKEKQRLEALLNQNGKGEN